MFRLHDALDAYRHGRGAMRNLVRFGALDDLRERVLEDAEKFVGHFSLGPHEGLQPLDPFEVGRRDAAAGE